MKGLFVGAVAGGTALLILGVVWALNTGQSDPGTRLAPSALGVAIVIATGGATLAASAIGIAAWFSPTLRLLREAQKDGSEAWVVQRGRGLRDALQELSSGHPVDTPSYLVVKINSRGFGIHTKDGEVVRVPARWIDNVGTGFTVTSRRAPSIVVAVTHPVGTKSVIEFVPSRPGFELFPILDTGQSAAVAARWSHLMGLAA